MSAGDVIVFFLLESYIIDVVQMNGNAIDFYKEESFSGSSTSTLYNIAFKARVFSVAMIRFHHTFFLSIDDDSSTTNGTTLKPISFSGSTENGQKFMSSSKHLYFLDSTSTSLELNMTTLANKQISLDLKESLNFENGEIRLTTLNDSVYLADSGLKISSLNITVNSYAEKGISLFFKEPGSYFLHTSIHVGVYLTSTTLFTIKVYPTFHKLTIVANTTKTYPLYPISLVASHKTNEYQFTWCVDACACKNISKPEIVQTFLSPGYHLVSLTVNDGFNKYTVTKEILIYETFHLNAPVHAHTNEAFQLTVEVLIPFTSYNSLIKNIDISIGNSSYDNNGTFWTVTEAQPIRGQLIIFDHTCLVAGMYTFKAYASSLVDGNRHHIATYQEVSCYDRVQELSIVIEEGPYPVLKNNFTLVMTTGGLTFGYHFMWTLPPGLTVMKQVGNKVIVQGGNSIEYNVTGTAIYPLSSVTSETQVQVHDSINYFELRAEDDNLNTHKNNITFIITRNEVDQGVLYQYNGNTVLHQSIDNNRDKLTLMLENYDRHHITIQIHLKTRASGYTLSNCQNASPISCYKSISFGPSMTMKISYQYIGSNYTSITELSKTIIMSNVFFNLKIEIFGNMTLKHSYNIDIPSLGTYANQSDVILPFIITKNESVFKDNGLRTPLSISVRNKYTEYNRIVYVDVYPKLKSHEIYHRVSPKGDTTVYDGAKVFLAVKGITEQLGVTVEWSFGIEVKLFTSENDYYVVKANTYTTLPVNFTFSVDVRGSVHGTTVNFLLKLSNPVDVYIKSWSFLSYPILDCYLRMDPPYAGPGSRVTFIYGHSRAVGVSGRGNAYELNNFQLSTSGSANGNRDSSTWFKYRSAGIFEMAVWFYSTTGLTCEKRTLLTIDWPVSSITNLIQPASGFTHTNEVVTFITKLTAVTKPYGELTVSVPNSWIPDTVLKMDFRQGCNPYHQHCWISTLQYTFNNPATYKVTGYVSNTVSTSDLASNTLVVYDKQPQLNEYFEIVAQLALPNTATIISVIYTTGNEIQLESCVINFGNMREEYFNSSLPKIFSHIYGSSGVYEIRCDCYTSGSATFLRALTKAYVQAPLKILSTEWPTSCVSPGDTFNITAVLSAGTMIPGLDFTVSVDGRLLETPDFILTANSVVVSLKSHDYREIGQLSILFTMTNQMSKELSYQFNVCVMHTIQQITCQLQKALTLGQIATFPIKILPNVTGAMLIVFFGDDESHIFHETSSAVTIIDHLYQSEGIFNYSIRASNNISVAWFNSTLKVLSQAPNFTLHIPMAFENGGAFMLTSSISFCVNLSKPAFPAMNISYTLHYGDGNTSNKYDLDIGNNRPLSYNLGVYKYTSVGCFEASIHVITDISTEVSIMRVYVIDGDAMNATLVWLQSEEYFDNDTIVFHSKKLMRAKIIGSAPSCLNYRITVENLSTYMLIVRRTVQLNEDIVMPELLDTIGHMKIVTELLTYSNRKNSQQFKFISEQFFHLEVNHLEMLPGPLSANVYEKRFLVALRDSRDNDGSIVSLQFDFGDSKFTKSFPVNSFIPVSATSPFALRGWYKFYTEVKHLYTKTGTFLVKVTGCNVTGGVWTNKASLIALVLDIPCSAPYVNIPSMTSSNNIVNGMIPLVYKSNNDQKLIISASAHSSCGQSSKMRFEWSVYRVSKREVDRVIKDKTKPVKYVFNLRSKDS